MSGGHSFLISRHPTDLEHGPNHVAKLRSNLIIPPTLTRTPHPYQVAKLRSNLIGTQWMLYDTGASPAKLAKGTATGSARRELAHIWSQQNIVGREGPRRTRLTLPPLDEKASHLKPDGIAPSSREESLSRGFKQHKKRVACMPTRARTPGTLYRSISALILTRRLTLALNRPYRRRCAGCLLPLQLNRLELHAHDEQRRGVGPP